MMIVYSLNSYFIRKDCLYTFLKIILQLYNLDT